MELVILLYLVLFLVFLVVAYYLVKTAVKNGVTEALRDHDAERAGHDG